MLSLSTAAVLAAALAASGHQPAGGLVASAATPQTVLAATPALPLPVELPQPSAYAVRAPASLSHRPTHTTRALGIPTVALTAYQRSSAVIDAADPTCGLDWTLLAAIGQVESDHGQAGGSHLGPEGVARPAIVGPRLDGHGGTSRVADTDGGRLDGDRRYDRAVGPMQFLPSTWSAVAVDGDDDGRRNVQDIDDASLGSAVYLCADHDDLSTKTGERTALLRYNHSQAYAATVMAIARQLAGTSLDVSSATVRAAAYTGTLDLRRLGDGHVSAARQGLEVGRPLSESLKPTPAPSAANPSPPEQPSEKPTSGSASGSPTTTTEPTTDPQTAAPPADPATADPPADPATADPAPAQPPPAQPAPAQTTTPTTSLPAAPTSSDSTSAAPPPATSPAPTQTHVIPDPLPAELVGLTPDQVTAYDAAWTACDDGLVAGWSADAQATAVFTGCLATKLGVAGGDADLAAFVAWVGRR